MITSRRCQRLLIADELLVTGIEAGDIAGGVRTRPHWLTPWVRVTGTQVTDPAVGAPSGQSRVIVDVPG
jgi:hypothetical protein